MIKRHHKKTDNIYLHHPTWHPPVRNGKEDTSALHQPQNNVVTQRGRSCGEWKRHVLNTRSPTVVHVASDGRQSEIARNSNLLSTKSWKSRKVFSLFFLCWLLLSLSPLNQLPARLPVMSAIATAAALSLPISLGRSSKSSNRRVCFISSNI